MDLKETLSRLAELPQSAPTSAFIREKAYIKCQKNIARLQANLRKVAAVDGEHEGGNATMHLPWITHLVFEIVIAGAALFEYTVNADLEKQLLKQVYGPAPV